MRPRVPGEPLVEAETLKLTARARYQHVATATSPIPAPASDETKKEIQEDDEATLRELLVRCVTLLALTRELKYSIHSFPFDDTNSFGHFPTCHFLNT